MTSYRLAECDLSVMEQDDAIEDERPAGPPDRLPWRVAGPLLFSIGALAWTGIFMLSQV
jgi:hypothetical protein